MNKAPAFQFYAADFLSDEKVMLMSVCARGIYITLLALQWREGSIPADSKLIAKLCGCDSTAIESHWHELQSCFVSADSEGKRLINLRLEEQRLELDTFKQNRSEAGKKGAKSRWNKEKEQSDNGDSTANGSAIAQPLANDSSSSSSSSSKEKHTKDAATAALVVEIFEEWKSVLKHPHAQLDDKRRKRIQARLSEGLNADELKKSLRGVLKSPYHMGENQQKTLYTGIETVFRDRAQVEKFLALVNESAEPELDEFAKAYLAAEEENYNTFRRGGVNVGAH